MLNLIKRKHKTNSNEGHSTKQLTGDFYKSCDHKGKQTKEPFQLQENQRDMNTKYNV